MEAKLHDLIIFLEGSLETYHAVTLILEVTPYKSDKDDYTIWTYRVKTSSDDEYFDFINEFLDILENKYDALAALGIKRSNILFWLIYEYYGQCALGFSPQEMKRLGANGISLNVDCHQVADE